MPDHFDDCVCKLCKQNNPRLIPHTLGCMCLVCKAERDAEARREFWRRQNNCSEEGPAIVAPALTPATFDNRFDDEVVVAVSLPRHRWHVITSALCDTIDYYEEAAAIREQVNCRHEWKTRGRSGRPTYEQCAKCGEQRDSQS